MYVTEATQLGRSKNLAMQKIEVFSASTQYILMSLKCNDDARLLKVAHFIILLLPKFIKFSSKIS